MECPICIQPINPSNMYETVCGHRFHKNCLCTWFNSRLSESASCPLCREDIKYDRGIVEYWDPTNLKIKRIQNSKGDYAFYPNGKQRYSLKIDRKQNNRIIGGKIYNVYNFDREINLNTHFIREHYPKLIQLQQNSNYDIYNDL